MWPTRDRSSQTCVITTGSTGLTGGGGASWLVPPAALCVAPHRLSCRDCVCVWCPLSQSAAIGGRCFLAPSRVPWLRPAACLSCVPLGSVLLRRASSDRGRSRCAGRLSHRRGAFSYRGLSPPDFLHGCAGHVEDGQELGSWCLLLAPAEAEPLGSLRTVPVRGPATGYAWRIPPASVFGCLRCAFWAVWTRSLTRQVFRTVYRFKEDSAGAPGHPFPLGGGHTQVWCMCACVCSSLPGWAGRPPGPAFVHLDLLVAPLVACFVLSPLSRRGLRSFCVAARLLCLPFLPFFPGMPSSLAFLCLLPQVSPSDVTFFQFSFPRFAFSVGVFFFPLCAPPGFFFFFAFSLH